MRATTPTRHATPSSSRLRSALIVLVTILLSLAICEIVLRMVMRKDNIFTTATLGMFVPDPELVWVNQPNVRMTRIWGGREIHIRTDARGHRIPEGVEPDAGGARDRVVFAGDSFVFGNEVAAEETFVQLVAQSPLRRRVVNLGVNGYTVSQSARMLERFLEEEHGQDIADAYEVIYVGNDIEERESLARAMRVDRFGFVRHITARSPWLENARSFAVSYSRMAFYLGPVCHALYGAVTGNAEEPPRRWIYDPQSFTHEKLAEQRRALETLRDDAAARGIRLTVLLLPERDQVYGSLSDLPERMLTTMITELGIHEVDLLPAMRAAAAERPPLWNDLLKSHLSPDGHRLVAEAIRQDLEVYSSGESGPAPSAGPRGAAAEQGSADAGPAKAR